MVSLWSCCAFTCVYSAWDLLSFLNWRTQIFVHIREILVHCRFKWYPPFSPSVSSIWIDIRPYSVLRLLIFIYSYNLFISLCCILGCILNYILMFIIYLVIMFKVLVKILIGNTCVSLFKTFFHNVFSLVTSLPSFISLVNLSILHLHLYYFLRVVIIKYYQLDGLKIRNVLSCNSKVKVSAGQVPPEGCGGRGAFPSRTLLLFVVHWQLSCLGS